MDKNPLESLWLKGFEIVSRTHTRASRTSKHWLGRARNCKRTKVECSQASRIMREYRRDRKRRNKRAHRQRMVTRRLG